MDNVTYIQQWFLENNLFLKERQDKYKMLHILVFYVLVFESFEKINQDQIVKIGNSYEVIPGYKVENETSESILKMVNVQYANLEYEDLFNQKTYHNFFYLHDIQDGQLDYEWLSMFETIYDFLKRHYENYNYNKYTYKIDNKVFYSLNELSPEEINLLSQMSKKEQQLLWEVFHEDGKMVWY